MLKNDEIVRANRNLLRRYVDREVRIEFGEVAYGHAGHGCGDFGHAPFDSRLLE